MPNPTRLRRRCRLRWPLTRLLPTLVPGLAGLALAAAPAQPLAPDLIIPGWGPGGAPAAPWRLVRLPDRKVPVSSFDVVPLDGEAVLRATTAASYGSLVWAIESPPPRPGRLHWRWRIDQPVEGGDPTRRDRDDKALKVCALFDLPLSALGFWERSRLLVARSLTGEPLPAATVCWIWDAALPVGTMLPSAYTRRVRQIVVSQGPDGLGRWQSFERDLEADFLRAFGDESRTVPPLVALAIGADSDNSGARSLAWLAPLRWADH